MTRFWPAEDAWTRVIKLDSKPAAFDFAVSHKGTSFVVIPGGRAAGPKATQKPFGATTTDFSVLDTIPLLLGLDGRAAGSSHRRGARSGNGRESVTWVGTTMRAGALSSAP